MLTPDQMQERLEGFPRLRYGLYPTPLEPLDNLTAELNGPRLWVKRDDQIGPGMGGNKGRKLEFLMGEVQRLGLEQGTRDLIADPAEAEVIAEGPGVIGVALTGHWRPSCRVAWTLAGASSVR